MVEMDKTQIGHLTAHAAGLESDNVILGEKATQLQSWEEQKPRILRSLDSLQLLSE